MCLVRGPCARVWTNMVLFANSLGIQMHFCEGSCVYIISVVASTFQYTEQHQHHYTLRQACCHRNRDGISIPHHSLQNTPLKIAAFNQFLPQHSDVTFKAIRKWLKIVQCGVFQLSPFYTIPVHGRPGCIQMRLVLIYCTVDNECQPSI